MTTSGSYNYSVTAAQVIYAAAEDIGIVAGGATINSNDETSMLRRLNFIAKQWQGTSDMSQGLKIWSRKTVTVFLAKNQQTYLVGPAATDNHATTQYGRTTISAAEASGQTTISITSNTDTSTYPGTTVTMTDGDNIGIQLDDGTLQWTTISGTPSTTATIAAALTDSAAAGNYIYWYTTKAQRFVDIEFASLRNENIIDMPLNIYRNVKDYERIPQKGATGDPTALLVEPLTLNSRVTLNTYPQDVYKQLRLTVLYPEEDYDSTSNDIAFPQEWFAALEWELAFRSAPMMSRPWTQEMQQNYTVALAMARNLNPAKSTDYFQPGRE